MKRHWLVPVLLATAFLIAGCVTRHWTTTNGPYTVKRQNISVTFPPGWMRNLQEDRGVLVTRDGADLQRIHVWRVQTADSMLHTKRRFTAGMLPQEVAELYLDDVRSAPGRAQVEVQENSPSAVDGLDGFRLVYTYREEGLKQKAIAYGAMTGNDVYLLEYSAPERHYFKKDVETFERLKQSFKRLSQEE